MYKKRKTILENMLIKKGCKYKTENILKGTVKKIQKTVKNKNSTLIIKNSIIKSADSQVTAKQVLKKGKRKKVLQSTIILISEKAIFSNSWKKVVKKAKLLKKNSAVLGLMETVAQQEFLLSNNDINPLLKPVYTTVSTKFRW